MKKLIEFLRKWFWFDVEVPTPVSELPKPVLAVEFQLAKVRTEVGDIRKFLEAQGVVLKKLAEELQAQRDVVKKALAKPVEPVKVLPFAKAQVVDLSELRVRLDNQDNILERLIGQSTEQRGILRKYLERRPVDPRPKQVS